ncbi:MAG: S-layer protein, partial [Candidatus Aenigmarchaeota archaeon]|nr:S-layer protein [Candidatus Aenigmarchaeota archaeon]
DAEIAFLNNITVGTSEAGNSYELLGIAVTLADGINEITGTSINYTYENATSGVLTIETASEPSVAILEEEGEDLSGTDVQNAVIAEAGDNAAGITIKTGSGTPLFSDIAATGWLSTSDSDVDVASDRYGVLVQANSDEQGTADVYYPDTQAVMAVGIGSNPVFSVSGEGGTVKEAYQITSAIGKLANEISSPSTLNRDVILVGGPCANTLVATLMDVASTWPECGVPFENLNDGIIKEYTDAFGSGQKALVIAGVVGDDTRALAARVLSGTMDYEA